MNTYTITRVSAAPDWTKIPALGIDRLQKPSDTDVRARARFACDDAALYVRLEADEREIRAVEQPPFGEPCLDSCLEFFFCPVPGDPRYFNIEFTPTTCMFLGLGSGLEDLIRFIPDYTDHLFDPKVKRHDGGWSIEYTIPYAFIRRFFPAFSAEKGTAIRANCYKCGNKTVKPHYLAWTDIVHKPFTFHRPEDFGTMIFG